MEEEDVILENSPLQKYLNEIGFTEVEDANGLKCQEEFEKHNTVSVWSYKEGLCQCLQRGFEIAWYISTSLLSWLILAPSVNDIEAFRNDYIVAVYESQTLKKDDSSFLSQFDPKLFGCRRACEPIASGHGRREWSSFVSGRYAISVFIVLISVILATINGLVFTSLVVLFLILFLSGTKLLLRYFFILHHQNNLAALKLFTMQTKQLTLLLKKSINLIQEMELISKGYTMVGPAMPAFFSENCENLTGSVVYPALRENVMKNTEPVVSCLQNSAKKLFLHFPLSPELARIFTYLSTGSIGDLRVGIAKMVSDDCTDKMSLQGLKNMTSLIVSLQSEFLSRFLLCLSVEANDGNLYELYVKLFKNIKKIFGISSTTIKCSITSIKRCYHIHESYSFMSKELEKPPVKPCTKWTALDIAIHSMLRHLQVGILRVQSFQKELYQHSEPTGEHEYKAKHSPNVNLDTTFQWLKSDLESALTCWQEGETHLNKLLGKEPTEHLNIVSRDTVSDEILEESKDPCLLDLKEDVQESGKVYEAFSDPYDDVTIDHLAVNAEDVEKELNVARENKRLLQELKTVLLTKAKDPLIGTVGFVQPAVKSPVHILSDTSNVHDKTWPNDSKDFITVNKEKETTSDSNLNGSCLQKWLSSNEVHNEMSCVEASEQHTEHPMLLKSLQSSVAVSVAAAAVAQNRALGLNEDTFYSDDTD